LSGFPHLENNQSISVVASVSPPIGISILEISYTSSGQQLLMVLPPLKIGYTSFIVLFNFSDWDFSFPASENQLSSSTVSSVFWLEVSNPFETSFTDAVPDEIYADAVHRTVEFSVQFLSSKPSGPLRLCANGNFVDGVQISIPSVNRLGISKIIASIPASVKFPIGYIRFQIVAGQIPSPIAVKFIHLWVRKSPNGAAVLTRMKGTDNVPCKNTA